MSRKKYVLNTDDLINLATREGFEVEPTPEGTHRVHAYGKIYTLSDPASLYLKIYRDNRKNPQIMFTCMKRVHDFLWPQYIDTWNHWTERRFQAHCEGYKVVVYAGGAAIGKSLDAAKIDLIYYLTDPLSISCVITSTTLRSVQSRIWGYVVKLLRDSKLPLPLKYFSSMPPSVRYVGQNDQIHGMYAAAIKQGDDERTIGDVIGRHPDYGLNATIDESTSVESAIIKAIPNWEQGVEEFRLKAIGNSRSKNDLHGALATPKNGWDSVKPERDWVWETKQEGGICLYFYPWDSPAILEKDPVRKEKLSKFLVTKELIEKNEKKYGKDSESFMRFTLGWWPEETLDDITITEKFLSEHEVTERAEWSGYYPLAICAGLDPAFQLGGTGCVLRLAVYGQDVNGKLLLDFKGEELLHRIELRPNMKISAEQQLADRVLEILAKYGCPLRNVCMDATGIGRALGGLIHVVSREPDPPIRIVSARTAGLNTSGRKKNVTDPHILVMSPSDLWLQFRAFVQHGHIRGLDSNTITQVTHRLINTKPNGKMVLETKEEYKTRMATIDPSQARSPDEADAVMLTLQAAIYTLGLRPGLERPLPNFGNNELLFHKVMAFQGEKRPYVDVGAPMRPDRPRLVPNFGTSLEQSPPKAGYTSKARS